MAIAFAVLFLIIDGLKELKRFATHEAGGNTVLRLRGPTRIAPSTIRRHPKTWRRVTSATKLVALVTRTVIVLAPCACGRCGRTPGENRAWKLGFLSWLSAWDINWFPP